MEIKAAINALNQMQRRLLSGKPIEPESVHEKRIDEVIAFVKSQDDEIANYERIATEYMVTVDAQHTTIEQLNGRIAQLTADYKEVARDQLAIAPLLTDAGIEHSGYKKQAARVEMLIERRHTSQRNVVAFAKERNDARKRVAELETQLAAALAVNDIVTCPDCSTAYNSVDYWCCPKCRRGNQFAATGQDYAEGCAP